MKIDAEGEGIGVQKTKCIGGDRGRAPIVYLTLQMAVLRFSNLKEHAQGHTAYEGQATTSSSEFLLHHQDAGGSVTL